MFHSIYTYLLWANPKNSANSEEQFYYDTNASLFNDALIDYNDNSSIFNVIRAVAVLRALKNRKILDEYIEEYTDIMLKNPFIVRSLFEKLPYLTYQGEKIYLPTYPLSINRRYQNETYTLKDFPYASILNDSKTYQVNPFETYGDRIYSSLFTRLVELNVDDKNTSAYYHSEFETLLIINHDGTLEQEIPLFDEGIKIKNCKDLFQRLEKFLKVYYSGKRNDVIESLYENELISKGMKEDLLHVAEKIEKHKGSEQ